MTLEDAQEKLRDAEIIEALGWESEKEESETQKQFREDMAAADREVGFYSGRFYYRGWATEAEDLDDLQAIIRATDVLLQWDQLGKDGFIVYPQ